MRPNNRRTKPRSWTTSETRFVHTPGLHPSHPLPDDEAHVEDPGDLEIPLGVLSESMRVMSSGYDGRVFDASGPAHERIVTRRAVNTSGMLTKGMCAPT